MSRKILPIEWVLDNFNSPFLTTRQIWRFFSKVPDRFEIFCSSVYSLMTSPHGMQRRLTAAAAQLWRPQNIGLTLKTYKSKYFRPIFNIFAPFDALMNSLKCSRVSFSGGERFPGHLGKTVGGTLGPPPPPLPVLNG